MVGKPLVQRLPLVYRGWYASRRPSSDEPVSIGEQLKRELAEQRLSLASLLDTVPDDCLDLRPAIAGSEVERCVLLACQCELFSDSGRNLLRWPAPANPSGAALWTRGDAGEGGAHLDIAGSAQGTSEVLRTLVGFGHLQHTGIEVLGTLHGLCPAAHRLSCSPRIPRRSPRSLLSLQDGRLLNAGKQEAKQDIKSRRRTLNSVNSLSHSCNVLSNLRRLHSRQTQAAGILTDRATH